VLVYFGYPQAHEDDAERAIMAGLAIVDAISTIGQQGSGQLQCRIGIATGLVVVGDLLGTGAAQEQAVVGETPNLAARLQALAEPGTVVVAQSTRTLIGDLFECRDLGTAALKGMAEPVQVWQALRRGTVDSRFEALRSTGLSQLVGREEEIELILRRWRQVCEGSGRVVLLMGEPGIGKSRITAAVFDAMGGEPHLRLRYFCSPHRQDSVLFPFAEQMQRAAGFEHNDTAETKLAKLEATLIRSSDNLDEAVSVYADLVGISNSGRFASLPADPHRRRQLTLSVMVRQLEGLARHHPILIVLEDAHWLDPTSRELLELVVERVPGLPVLLLVTFRPEFQPPWTGQAHVTTLTLNRLGARDSRALIEQIAAATPLPPEVISQIVERTDGVPLFVEELTKTVLESGFVADRDGRRSPLMIPASLQDSLMARLDRLAPARQVAQIGAAIGRSFSYELTRTVSQLPEAELQQGLDRLVASELIFRRGTPPRADYVFKHALVQDVAYATMLRPRRQELHTRIAHALEHSGNGESEVLAHHYTEAQDLDRAAEHWLQAGRAAARRSANVEAIVHLTRGIRLLGGLAATEERARAELELQLALGPALMATRGWNAPEAEIAYHRAQQLSLQLDDDRRRFHAVWGSWLVGAGQGAWNATRDIVTELFQIAEKVDEPEFRLEAHHAAWGTTTFLGELTAAREHVTRGLALYDPHLHRSAALLYGGHDPGVCGKALGSLGLWLTGYPEQAARSACEGIALAETLEHAPSLAHALAFAALCHQLRRDAPAVFECGQRLAVLGSEHGLAQYKAVGTITRGWALAHMGQASEGLAEQLKGLEEYGETRVQAWLVYFKATLAEVYHCVGDAESGLAAVGDALALSDSLGERFWQAGMLHRKGAMLGSLGKDHRDEAEHCYREALAISTEQQARSIALRAATSLARLWHHEGRDAEAGDLLRPLHGMFTEGHDTPDLLEARALLGGLR
jgi:predicted ATPase